MSSIAQFGRYVEEKQCFELTESPPRKWNNFHYNGIGDHELVVEVSNIGDGQAFVRDRVGNTCRIISWDSSYLYIRDEESGEVFCPWGEPAPHPVENRVCRFYAAKTEISSECCELSVTQRVFVPRPLVAEVWSLFLSNLSDRPRRLSLFAYAGFDLSGSDANGNSIYNDNFGEVHPEMGGVLVSNRTANAPTDRYNGYIIALKGFSGGSAYRDHFTRSDFGLGTPRILWGWNADNRSGFGPDCAGIVQVTLELPPRGSTREDFLIGQTTGMEEVIALRSVLSSESLDEMLSEQERIHEERSRSFTVDLGEEHRNRSALMNFFVKNQLARYLIEGVGLRDNLQNDNAGVLINPEQYVANTLYQLQSQYPDGSVPQGLRPLRRRQYSDQPAWILLTIPGLVEETGDLGLLERTVGYLDSSEVSTVWEHMVRAMRFLSSDLGKNGLCDQHYADWNDGLEATQEAGDRESVMVTMQLCYGLRQMDWLADTIGDNDVRDEARQLYTTFAKRLNDTAWDGNWYVRTICGDGYRIGSHTNEEGRIFVNSQSWAVLSGVADGERARTCMNAVEEHLHHDVGYRICAPAFSKYDPRVGHMSSSMPGHIENGGCYCHGATFKALADCLLGRAEEAWSTWVKLAPDSPTNPVSQSMVEPFSFTNSYTTVKQAYGRAGYPWRTGTAGWMTVLLVERILGARRSLNGLLVDPCLTKNIPHARVTRRFRNAVYHLDIDNSAGRCVGAQKISVDGHVLEGNVLPVFAGGEHSVKVVI